MRKAKKAKEKWEDRSQREFAGKVTTSKRCGWLKLKICKMSVEKTIAEEAKSSLPVSNLDTTTRQGENEEARHVEVGLADGKSRVDEATGGGSRPELQTAKHTIQPVSHEIRTWFQGLDTEERSDVASFADGAFLSSFLALAAPWSGGPCDQQPRSQGEY